MNLLTAVLIGIAVTTALFALFYRPLFTPAQMSRRMQDILEAAPNPQDPNEGLRVRRMLLANRLAEVAEEERHRRQMTLKILLSQAGVKWTVRQYVLASIGVGVLCTLLFLVMGASLLALPLGIVLGTLLPRQFLKVQRARRIKAFVKLLPDALEAMARSMRAGLHISEALRIIVREGQEPLRGEFQVVADEQAIGSTLAEALKRMHTRIPVEETRFLTLAISLQAGEGGGLAETLNSLANTMRERRKLTDKISAMTAEARASAMLLASLPYIGLVVNYLIDPEKTSLLWTTTIGRVTLLLGTAWVLIGFFVMKRLQAIKV
ncbi:type II secretion system F family protein [Xanthobacter sp. TB0139]|uniref:type II secretion system F family protein n=1 Tax=Xanthobacter sp. TB0139 TaxID=3459178 RepID=UPI004039F0F5